MYEYSEKLHSFIDADALQTDAQTRRRLGLLCRRWMQHQFSLLGSEWKTVDFDLDPPGFRGMKYNTAAMKMYGRLTGITQGRGAYRRINWFVDYKSGFFFHPLRFNSLQKCTAAIGKHRGVDIKCPWELGRLYHLPPMAVYAHGASDEERVELVREFYDEITDFIRANPIGRTVQWSAPMDVSVRIVNILIAFDLFRQTDKEGILDSRFERRLVEHIEKSAAYLLENLEFAGRGGVSSNHYLSNLAGLTFAAAYLPETEKTDAWLAFAAQELIEETGIQFYPEGSNFEGSTSYHRLSTEFVLYATALLCGVWKTDRKKAFSAYKNGLVKRLKKPRAQKYEVDSPLFFPKWYFDRLCCAGRFTNSVLKSNYEIVQIGDNDSGRLVKLTPLGTFDPGSFFDENVLDHRSLLSAMSGLFENTVFESYGEALPLESSLVQALSGGCRVRGTLFNVSAKVLGEDGEMDLPYKKESVLFEEEEEIPPLTEGAGIEYFQRFGIVILRSPRVFLSFVIDTTQYSPLYGHTHNDKMSLELMIDGRYITRDPGGYIYTACPEARNRFRSVQAHNCIHVADKEQNGMVSCFAIKRRARGKLLYCDTHRIIAKASYLDVEHVRRVEIFPHKITVCDYANQPFEVKFRNTVVSKGYGKLETLAKERR